MESLLVTGDKESQKHDRSGQCGTASLVGRVCWHFKYGQEAVRKL